MILDSCSAFWGRPPAQVVIVGGETEVLRGLGLLLKAKALAVRVDSQSLRLHS